MLEYYFEASFTLEQLRNCPRGTWVDGFARSLHEDGYSWWTGRTYLRAASHLGHFLHSRDITLVAVQPGMYNDFRLHLRHCRCPGPRGKRAADTIRGAKHFLTELGDDPGQYDAECLRSFLLHRAQRRGVGGTKAILSPVRMFLRYLAIEGKCKPDLDAAIPAIAGWRLASLPRCLSVDEVERLPLPQEVGDAILAYLEHRPSVHDDHVFLRGIAPFIALPGSSVS